MCQTSLIEFEKIVPSFSKPETCHIVRKINGIWECSCDGFWRHGHCVHASREIQAEALKTKNHCAIIMDMRSQARFKTFENVVEYFNGSKDEEFAFLQCVALGIAYEREVCADDLHYATKERFKNNPKIIGTALRSLTRKGHLQIVGEKHSERDACHHRIIKRFCITDTGRKYLNEGGIQ